MPPADAAQIATAQPAPSAEETPNTPDAATAAARLAALAGGWAGGGFVAPPIDSPFVGYDFTVPFRELVSSCGAVPAGAGISLNEKISIAVRVFLNRDGSLRLRPGE